MERAGTQGAQGPNVNDLTVLVFQDNLAARAFKVPLAWITRLGWVLGALLALTVLASVLAARFYKVSRSADPARLHDLETELAEVKASYKALETKAATPEAPRDAQVPPPAVAQPNAPVITAAPVDAGGGGTSVLFSALPSRVGTAPEGSSVIRMTSPRVSWSGRTLRVNFDLQYVGQEHGSQQGRIILLARGPETLLAHPNGALNLSGVDTLIAPEQGEYFSVSRFRSVTAEFGPVRSQNALREVEVLVLNQDSQILIHQVLKPTAAPPAPARVRERPADEDEENDSPAPQAPAAGAPAAPAAPAATQGGTEE